MSSPEMNIDLLRSAYSEVRPSYKGMTKKVRDLLAELVAGEKVLSVSGRTKDVESFISKTFRRDDDGGLKYDDPLNQFTDFSGVRVICYTVSQATTVCEIVRSNFEVVEFIDKAVELRGKRKLGYASLHLLVKFKSDRSGLPDFKRFNDLVCEVQIRTILQHAWAEIEHRVQYKKDIDDNLHSKFLALAGLIQIADREFEGIVALNNEIEAKIAKDLPLFDISDADLNSSEVSAGSLGGAEDIGPVHAGGKKGKGKPANLVKAGWGGRKLHSIKYMFGVGPAELVQAGEYDKADAVYSEFINAQPSQSGHFEGRARARALMGRIEEAKADLQKAIQLSPGIERLEIALQRLETPNG